MDDRRLKISVLNNPSEKRFWKILEGLKRLKAIQSGRVAGYDVEPTFLWLISLKATKVVFQINIPEALPEFQQKNAKDLSNPNESTW